MISNSSVVHVLEKEKGTTNSNLILHVDFYIALFYIRYTYFNFKVTVHKYAYVLYAVIFYIQILLSG